ncbi:hypothetical protein [Riemerella anatipestifer]|uniref:hypothetical protein n=1 Tax=Riemerella anatipestifer TaxID=34085 RepID=UPI001C1E64FA|nr:hypothetical protein [Riemerella anatipestifer]MCW0492525.1 hypothetical protein [Riemerella anatipestifer]MDR7749992.1 hypothetical protein [Riemerella anatipestifer]MDR7752226.1 hypothetical protein [Riemerella anatipestifer]MDR7754223.1 hypothetical protein [Riemerella anatipestifer]MDR7758492.1 hypothetical protein [Riemerella anatipestifer]
MDEKRKQFAEFATKIGSSIINELPEGACVLFVSSLEKCSGFSNVVKGEGIKIAATLGVAFSQNPKLAELVRMALESYDKLEKK